MNVNKPGTSWIFQADDFSDGEVQRDRFAIKFKLPESATNFKNAIQDLKKEKLNESMNKSGNIILNIFIDVKYIFL